MLRLPHFHGLLNNKINMQAPTATQPRHWDIFCKVIDNFGDIGVCWRLACNLARRGQQVRLWVDDATALAWMAPQGHPQVQVCPWTDCRPHAGTDQPGDVVIEAFGCEIDHAWIATAAAQACVWINLEYLSAEPYAARNHGLPSPVMHGPAAGRTKWFFYPGFTEGTGGLLRESGLEPALSMQGGDKSTAAASSQRISLFCYEPTALPGLLNTLSSGPVYTDLQVTHGRASAAVPQALPDFPVPPSSSKASFTNQNPSQSKHLLLRQLSISEHLQCSFLPTMPQTAYDELLRSCQLNFVRGEDSLVRALWAGQAFVWQIYPQGDGAHAAKLNAFLDWLQAPADLRLFHHVWNGLSTQRLPPLDLVNWQLIAQNACKLLWAQPSLADQLIAFRPPKTR
jgi:uncharacterized repeat protein (TIGR03837 family)